MIFIILDKKNYNVGEKISINYQNGPGNTTDWVGIYKIGETPGSVNSTLWSYVNSSSLTSGSLSFQLNTAGEYYAAFFSSDGYTEISSRIYFYVGALPQLSSDKLVYNESDNVNITAKLAPANSKDWIGLYKAGQTPGGNTTATSYQYISADSAVYTFKGLPKGYYFACYFLDNGYNCIGDTIYFSVGDLISTIATDKSAYDLGDLISVTFSDGPGKAKDWLGIYNEGDDPKINPLLYYTYVGGQTNGTASFAENNVPKKAGNYYVVFFTNDSYNEISNRAYFKINSDVSAISGVDNKNQLSIYPNPMVPGKETVIKYQYPINDVEIYTLNGGLIYSRRNISNANTITINHNLPAGLYLVKVTANNHSYTLKLTVKNE